MPVTTELKDDRGTLTGVRLVFDASPSDTLDVDVYSLSGGASAIIVTRTGDGTARAGGLGPQIASLLREAEDKIKLKLQLDCDAFARTHTLQKRAGTLRDDADAEEQERRSGHDGVAAAQSRDASSSSSSSSSGTIEDAVLSDTAFPGGAMHADPMDSYPGGREVFEKDAFAAFENVRTAGADTALLEKENSGVKGVEGVLEDLKAHSSTDSQIIAMFEAGRDAAIAGQEDQLAVSPVQDLVQLGVILGPATGLQGGLDLFAGPPQAIGGEFDTQAGEARADAPAAAAGGERVYTMYDEDDVPVLQLTESELAAIDADALELEMARLDGMLYELGRAPAEMRPAILREYADVLLDPYYVLAMRARVPRLETEAQRALLQAVNAQATTLVGQLAGLKQAQEVQELEKIRAICETAMDDMARLPDKVRSMKPLLNADFVAYLAYAIEKERGALRAKGMDPDREPSRWLQVLGVIKQGVFAELEKDVYLDVQAIHYVLRMREPDERRALLEATIATLPSMDVRGFRRVARNIAEHVAARSDGAVDAALRARVAEFAELMDELLPDARVEALSREADDWAAQRVADRDAVRRAVARARPNPSAFGGGTFSETYGADGSEDYGGGAAAALLGPETAPEAAPVTAETVAAAAAGAVDLTELYRQQSVEGEDAFGDGAGEEWGLWDEGEVDGSVVGGNRGEAVPGMLGGARFGTGGDEQQTSGSDGRVLTDEFGDELDDDASSW